MNNTNLNIHLPFVLQLFKTPLTSIDENVLIHAKDWAMETLGLDSSLCSLSVQKDMVQLSAFDPLLSHISVNANFDQYTPIYILYSLFTQISKYCQQALITPTLSDNNLSKSIIHNQFIKIIFAPLIADPSLLAHRLIKMCLRSTEDTLPKSDASIINNDYNLDLFVPEKYGFLSRIQDLDLDRLNKQPTRLTKYARYITHFLLSEQPFDKNSVDTEKFFDYTKKWFFEYNNADSSDCSLVINNDILFLGCYDKKIISINLSFLQENLKNFFSLFLVFHESMHYLQDISDSYQKGSVHYHLPLIGPLDHRWSAHADEIHADVNAKRCANVFLEQSRQILLPQQHRLLSRKFSTDINDVYKNKMSRHDKYKYNHQFYTTLDAFTKESLSKARRSYAIDGLTSFAKDCVRYALIKFIKSGSINHTRYLHIVTLCEYNNIETKNDAEIGPLMTKYADKIKNATTALSPGNRFYFETPKSFARVVIKSFLANYAPLVDTTSYMSELKRLNCDSFKSLDKIFTILKLDELNKNYSILNYKILFEGMQHSFSFIQCTILYESLMPVEEVNPLKN